MRSTKARISAAKPLRMGLTELGWPVILILGTALLLGGGGSRYGILNWSIQLLALALLCWFHSIAYRSARSLSVGIAALLVATVALPLLHLVPLPSGVWQGLPGREVAVETRELIGVAGDWFPASLDRTRTLAAFAALIPPLAILLLIRFPEGRRDFRQAGLRLLVLLALLNLLLGGFQIATGGISPLPYPVLDSSRSYGFFANHNTSGLFSVVGLCALAGVRFPDRGFLTPLVARFLLGCILVIATVLTQSRSSNALLLLPLSYFAVRVMWQARNAIDRKILFGSILALGVFAAGASYLLSETRLSATLERFEDLEDARPDIWADAMVSAKRFFPVGSGMGTFDEVFQLDESLETLNPGFARRAHNDYIEIAVEAGGLGLAIVIAWLIWGIANWYRALGPCKSNEGAAAGLALACIALQSFVDYPLRNQALLCVAAVLVAVLAQPLFRTRVR